MAPEQESKPAPQVQGTAQSSPPARRGRQSGGGPRGRGRRPQHQERTVVGEPTGATSTQAAESPLDSLAPVSEPSIQIRSESPAQPTSAHRLASPIAIQQAIEEVNHIIDTLRETLDEMEEVLETLELAERQQDADEREIESLRRALRPLQRPRGGS